MRKAREVLGEKAPTFGRGYGGDEARRGGAQGGRGGTGRTLGKRKRDDEGDGESGGSETDESVRKIPMPRDTPPPISPHHLRRHDPKNANLQPLGEGRGGERMAHALPPRPDTPVQAQTVYEAKPVVRNLRKEAVSAFVPSVVQRKFGASKGEGRLLEPEEMDKLEQEGYTGGGVGSDQAHGADGGLVVNAAPAVGRGGDDDHKNSKKLKEEEARFEREVRGVQMEEVEDEDL